MKPQTDSAIDELMSRPLSERARGFLREVQHSGGRADVAHDSIRQRLAQECRRCGYLHICADERTVKLTGLGQAYLDRLMRAN
ncbi:MULTISPECIES: hypothetical protein [Rhizobium]|uniref:Uncharacterized protein n=1 Tax=Rhizobium tropici TaxID=398 RepID=A0A6P1BYZ7_RHITR|nr:MULTISPECIES: hypothetical protein [Rhizobium]AGB71836.1 hypothetical protein RTCIAT899_CH12280 [Rhizobium tropici CIAT 899]MBB4243731.1 hypothetical protein [Rhizobium tropici]MBB5593294.1 hypothetical protein [Rhizobium tropici]MBB6494071.1 hypothetical protein [Rhizobium tropici]NEV09768.1 hypothetical protein [Rhizobium tropici]